jgi:hypothetical protein
MAMKPKAKAEKEAPTLEAVQAKLDAVLRDIERLRFEAKRLAAERNKLRDDNA